MKRFGIVKGWGVAILLATLSGCVSIGTPLRDQSGLSDYGNLPVEQLREVANEIEAAVSAGNREPAIANRDSVIVDSEEVVQAIRTRAARAELVGEFRATGHAVEQQNGMLHILRSQAYKKSGTRRTRDRDAVLVMGENDNRWSIYEGILEASDFPPKSLGAIQTIFAQARIEHLGPAEKYENEMGERVAK